jgi:thiol-disulfide isomerase/thioredoxin
MADPVWRVLIVLLIAIAVVQAIVLIGVMRQVGAVLLQLHPPRVGEMPDQGPELGAAVDFSGHVIGRPALVLFISPTCGLCKPLVPAIAALRRAYREEKLEVIAAIIGGSDSERERYAAEVGEAARTNLTTLEEDWRVPGTPFVVGIDSASNVYKTGVANSLDQLESLAEEVASSDRQVASRDSGEALAVARNGSGITPINEWED